jgi:hypothetical protein
LGQAEIHGSRTAGVRLWVPKFVLTSMIIFGILIWVIWAYVRQAQLFWIPEADLWYRLGTCMGESWQIPLIFWAVGGVSFILLKKKVTKGSARSRWS